MISCHDECLKLIRRRGFVKMIRNMVKWDERWESDHVPSRDPKSQHKPGLGSYCESGVLSLNSTPLFLPLRKRGTPFSLLQFSFLFLFFRRDSSPLISHVLQAAAVSRLHPSFMHESTWVIDESHSVKFQTKCHGRRNLVGWIL